MNLHNTECHCIYIQLGTYTNEYGNTKVDQWLCDTSMIRHQLLISKKGNDSHNPFSTCGSSIVQLSIVIILTCEKKISIIKDIV